jgi:hypothetical protein
MLGMYSTGNKTCFWVDIPYQMGNCVVILKNDIEGSFKLEVEEISASLG